MTSASPPASAILAALGQAVFEWDLGSDRMSWSEEVGAMFPGLAPEKLATGAEFASLIEPSPAVRAAALSPANAMQGPRATLYRIEYGVRAHPAQPLISVEETGRWFTGPHGRPARVQGIVRLNNDGRAREEEMARLARLDPLTGELNRTQLLAALAETIREATRFHTAAAFLLIGIDHLARIYDAFGFEVADGVIAQIAKRIRARLRSADVLGRFSGNRFGLVLKSCTAEEASVAAERLLAVIREEMVPTRSGPVAVTASMAAVAIPRHARTTEEAVNRAHEALEQARRKRSGSFAIWQPDAARDARRRFNIRVIDAIVTALNQRRIVLAYEPIVDARTREPSAYECLVRIACEEGEVLAAPDIVPVAERLGLIRLLDQRVLDLVMAELIASPGIKLSLNISPETTQDPDWWGSIESLMRAHPDLARRLIVEITETVAIGDIDDLRCFVARLRNLGSRIAIDDFGAGYTSFRSLRKLGVDIVKIDGAFVQNLVHSADDRAFVQTLIDLARRLEITTVAEWVQDEEAASLLREWGCDYIQGRLVGLASPERPWVARPGAALPVE